MAELIALIIFLTGFFGALFIIIKKAPTLTELPEISPGSGLKEFILKLKEKIKNSDAVKIFSPEILPHKILSKIRVLTLKLDTKTSNWLQGLREKTKKKKIEEKNKKEDNYWKEIKTEFLDSDKEIDESREEE